MLEILRGYAAGLQADAGEGDDAEAALARHAVLVAGQAAAGMASIAGELAAARWLDAEAATMGHVLGWAVEHDLDTAARLVAALALWWALRGRLAGQEPVLHELARRAVRGSGEWCAAQFWLAWIASDAPDLPAALQRCAAVIDVTGSRGPSRMLADCLALQSVVLPNLGRIAEAAASARRALAMARELGYPFGQVSATAGLAIAASYAGDLDEAARLARQGRQIPGIPGTAARTCGYLLAAVLGEAGNLPAAEQAGRTGDAAAHLREAAQIALQTGLWFTMLVVLGGCGYLCAATGNPAGAITAWAAGETLGRQSGMKDADTDPYVRRLKEARHRTREMLGPDRARAAEQRGAAMNMTTAGEYALVHRKTGLRPLSQPLSGLIADR